MEVTPDAKRLQIPKCKVVFLGAAGVGKTSLINRFMYEQFSRDYETTVGIDYFTKKVTVDGRLVSLQVWDTAGQEEFQSLIPTYIRDTQIALIVYDVSDPKTLEAAKSWHKTVLDDRGHDAQCVLAGNKMDLESKIEESEVAAFCEKFKMKRMEVSAKTGQGVQELFKKVVELVDIHELEKKEATAVQAIQLTDTQSERQKANGCC